MALLVTAPYTPGEASVARPETKSSTVGRLLGLPLTARSPQARSLIHLSLTLLLRKRKDEWYLHLGMVVRAHVKCKHLGSTREVVLAVCVSSSLFVYP